jgi:hypothetical protein
VSSPASHSDPGGPFSDITSTPIPIALFFCAKRPVSAQNGASCGVMARNRRGEHHPPRAGCGRPYHQAVTATSMLAATDPFPPYLAAAACRAPGVDPAWFFPHQGDPAVRAKAICRACPELEPCRRWAVDRGQWLSGVWGGTSEIEKA